MPNNTGIIDPHNTDQLRQIANQHEDRSAEAMPLTGFRKPHSTPINTEVQHANPKKICEIMQMVAERLTTGHTETITSMAAYASTANVLRSPNQHQS